MRIAASIRILIVVILALCFTDQHGANLFASTLAKQEVTGHPAAGGNFATHELIEMQHGDDLNEDSPARIPAPQFRLPDTITLPVPRLAVTSLSSCWQPPEARR